MALQKQVVPIEIATGIDTKTDPKKVTGKLISLINAVFHEAKALLKRYGYVSKPQSILSGSSIASGVTISPYQNELVELDGKNLYSFSDQQSKWVNKGTFVTNTISTASIVKNSRGQTTQDQAQHSSGFQVFTWEDTAGGSYYSVLDTGTGQTLVNSALLSATGYVAKPIAIGNFVVIFYFDTSTSFLVYKAISMSTPTSIGSQVSVAGTPSTSGLPVNSCAYDVALINGILHIVFDSTAGLACYTLSSSLTLTNPRTVSLGNSAQNLAVFGDASNNVWIGYFQQTSGLLSVTIYTTSFAALVLAPTVIETISGYTLRNLVGITSGTTGFLFYESDQYSLFLSGTIQTFYGDYIRSNSITVGGTVGTPYNVIRSLGIASKPFLYSGSIYFLSVYDATRNSTTPGLVYDVSTENTYFVVDSLGNIVTKVAQLNGGGISKKFIAPEALTISSSSFQLSYLFKDLLVAENNAVYTQTGVQSVTVSFTSVSPSKLQIGEALLLGGGTLQQYDGAAPTEQNFHVYPELMTAWTGVFNGGLSAGQYEYESTYEWTDNQGQTDKSSTSDPLIVKTADPIISVATANANSTLTPNLGPTNNIFLSLQNLDVGFLVVGAGIPAAATITSLNIASGSGPFPSGIPQINISANATATAAEVNLTITPQLTLTGSSVDLSPDVSIDPMLYLPLSVLGQGTGSATFVASDLSSISVGMIVSTSYTSFAGSTANPITAINQTSRLVSTNTASFLSNGAAVVHVAKSFTGTFTSGSAVVTGVSSNAYSFITAGDTGIANSLPFGVLSFSSGASTVTLKTLYGGATGTYTATLYFPASAILKAGQTIAGTGIPANTTILSVTPPASNTNPETTILLSTNATSTQTSITYTFTNMFCNVLEVPTLRATNKGAVSLALYRTQDDQTLLYRVTSLASPTLNDRTIDFAYLYDPVSDQSIAGNEQLYTTGGEVDNSSPPASSVITTYKNRAVLIPNENQLTWWYSKQVIPGSPVEFSASFVENIDSRGGGITVPAAMDDKLILFKLNNIFYVVGEGPTPAGTQNDFTEAQLISTDTGCSNPASVVLTPDGLMFQSPKGIYLLARNMSVVYIGDAVEAYNTDTVTSAILIENLNQVRFTMLSGVCLVYDYCFKQWAVFTNIAAVDSCIFNGVYNYLTASGLVNVETAGTYTDNGAFIQMALTTSWMSLAGLQGFQRIWRLFILGQYVSPHTLLVNINTEFNGTPNSQNVTIPVTTNPAPYQFRIHMKQQKCEAIQFQIMDSQASSFGEGLQLSEITLEAGIKVGGDKLSAGKSY